MSSKIEWTEATWNPVTGCDKVSPGCAHCYAETFAERWRGVPGHPYEQGFDLRLWPDRLEQPLRWKRPRMIFVNSMSDLFHEDIPTSYIARGLRRDGRRQSAHVPDPHQAPRANGRTRRRRCRGQPNVWMGVTIENRRFVHRADACASSPAACVSSQPSRSSGRSTASTSTGIDWLIAGGESGHGHRWRSWTGSGSCVTPAPPKTCPSSSSNGAARSPKAGGRILDGQEHNGFPEPLACGLRSPKP